MRSDPAVFAIHNEASTKKPRFVIQIEYDVESIYMTSHAGISGVPGVVMENVLRRPAAVSQRIVPDEGRSEIGSFSFSLVDLASVFTQEIRDKLGDGKGLRGKTVRFWVGYSRFAPPDSGGFGSGGFGGGGFGEGDEGQPGPDAVFSEFQLFQTQIITGVSYDNGVYSIQCADITREQREDIFEPKKTTLRNTLAVGGTTVEVYTTVGFQPVYHGSSYSDGPNGVYGYIKVDNEWIRYTGKTADTFTGCTRGVLNTREVEHTVDAATDADRRPKVEEGIYLELPAVKLAYAVLTGIIHGTSPTQTLPPHWHLGISPDFVRLSDFTGIGDDLWDTTLDTEGFVPRFQGLSKITGKKFLETELYMLLGCYPPVYSDGTIGLKRMNQVLADAAFVTVLDSRNIISHGALEHDMSSLHNRLQIDWNWNGDRFTRSTVFIDAQSIATHGPAPLKKLQFKGLHGSRHTEAIIRKRLDSFRDRYTSVPETTTVDVLSSLNRLEVGDIIRDRMPNVRDYAGSTQNIDRSFEIQRRSCDYISGDVTLELFGSTGPASVEAPNDTGAGYALPDSYYNSEGTELSTVCTIVVVGGVGVIQAGTYNLTSGIYYYLGDLDLNDGATLTINGTVQIRVRGFCTINGDIDGLGRGKAGIADSAGYGTTQAGTPGFIGNSRGMDGAQLRQSGRSSNMSTITCAMTQGQYSAFPYLDLVVSGASLLGIPSDLAGTSGGGGGKVQRSQIDGSSPEVRLVGGTGANSGAGLAIICRGLAFGASGSINLSGASSAVTSVTTFPNYYAGAGGAGSPGGLLILLDGSAVSFPDVGGKFTAACGTVPINGTPMPVRGPVSPIALVNSGWTPPGAGYLDESFISNVDLSNVAYRIQYIPQQETPAEDDERPSAPYNLQLYRQFNDRILTWTPPPAGTYDSIEVYASITNNRADAVLIGEVTGSTLVFTPPPSQRGVLYYWNRSQRGQFFSDWFPLAAVAGIHQDSSLPDPQRIIPDPEFSLSTTLGAYWIRVGSTPDYTFEIHSSGGVAGGVGRMTMSGSNANLELYARRIPAMQATTGQVVEITARWRRTTAIANPLSQISVVAALASTEEPPLGSGVQAALISAAGTDREDDLNSFNINEWQEIRAVFRLQNNPKNQTQQPYLRVGVVIDPFDETGTIELDRVDAIFGTVI